MPQDNYFNYGGYSTAELEDVQANIDKARYPLRYKCLMDELAQRTNSSSQADVDVDGVSNSFPNNSEQLQPLGSAALSGHNDLSSQSEPVDIVSFDYFKGEYRCSLSRIITVNAVGMFFAGIVSLMSTSPSEASTNDFSSFFLFELLTFSALCLCLYTGKSVGNLGIVTTKRSFGIVTITQIVLSYLFFLGLFIGYKQFF